MKLLFKGIPVFVVCAFAFAIEGRAQTDFFWSDKSLGQGAVNEPLSVSAAPGEVVDFYLYYTINGQSNSDISRGLSIDLRLSPGARFLSAETFDFAISVGGQVITNRWNNGVFGPTGTITPQFIDELSCFGVISEGILEENTGPIFIDEGYDEEADAFLIGKVEVFVEAFCGINISASVGDNLIVNDSGFGFSTLNPTFGCAEICDPLGPGATAPEGCFTIGPILGDVNLDGLVNLLDVAPFVSLIVNGSFQAEADTNRDNRVDILDVKGMVNILAGRCPRANDGPIQPGDMNCDGCVDIIDAVQLREYLISTDPLPCDDTSDLNGDGNINLLEIDLLQELILNHN